MHTRPNILLITTDQQHFSTLGVVNDRISTPNLDRLAREGVRFDRAYCPNPLCSPSRASIITGQYPSTHGCWTIGTKLDDDAVTLPGLLGDAGYETSLIGKAHFQPLASQPGQESLEAPPRLRDLEFWDSFHGPYYGFSHIELARNHADEQWAGQHYALWMEQKGLTDWRDYFQDPEGEVPARQHSWDLPEQYHYTTFVAERSIAAIEGALDRDVPFFTWASFQDPHPPYLVPEPWASMYRPEDMEPGRLVPGELERMPRWYRETQKVDPDFSEWRETPYANHGFTSHLITDEALRRDMAVYYGMVSFVDHGIGMILDALEARGALDDTLIVFTTDHGHFLGQHGLIAKGAFQYEDLQRVPMLARYPARIPAGRSIVSLVSLVDIAPTFLAMAGEPVGTDMQGVDQSAVWAGDVPAARDHVIVENRHQPTKVHVRTYIEAGLKITMIRGTDDGEMFDLTTDPGETCNVFHDPAFAERKSALLERFARAELEREHSPYRRIAVA